MLVTATIFARDQSVYSIIPNIPVEQSDYNQLGMSVVDLAAQINKTSKSESRRFIEGGAMKINDIKVTSPLSRIVKETGENIWEFILYQPVD